MTYTGASTRRVLFDGIQLGDTGTTLVCSAGLHVVKLAGDPAMEPPEQRVVLRGTSAPLGRDWTECYLPDVPERSLFCLCSPKTTCRSSPKRSFIFSCPSRNEMASEVSSNRVDGGR